MSEAKISEAVPIAWVDIANWRDELEANECFFTDYQDEDTVPVYLHPQPAELAEPQDTSSWSLHDRVEFALRDAGFDLDEASRIALQVDGKQQVGEVQDERERFEAWATSKGLNTVRSSEEIDRYAHTDTFYAWQGYQAAPPAQGIDLGQLRQAVVHWYADADNANTNPGWVRAEADRLLALIDHRDAAPGVE